MQISEAAFVAAARLGSLGILNVNVTDMFRHARTAYSSADLIPTASGFRQGLISPRRRSSDAEPRLG
ncbi:hypothetical protein ACC689_35785, partial [Rhizobium ruizarguesonis]